MCDACGCGGRTALVCPDCGGRVILIDGETKCVACGASPSLEGTSPDQGEHGHHHGGHSHVPQDEAQIKSEELLAKLRVLLPHWIEHNAEHAQSFRAWAERARASGGEHLALHIEEAARKIEAANRNLEGVLEHMGVETSEPDQP
ncbi:MAG: hypothetical protein PVJ55_10475, partial [Anaerolineae bacterium]